MFYFVFLYLIIDIVADNISRKFPMHIMYAPTYILYIPHSSPATNIVYLIYFGFLKYVDVNSIMFINSGNSDNTPS